ncbi:hypothetical protein JTB14_005740 [Gonioctena quinquepunctata]|nr:hypothetical protein JTB14_005740 [Gonioctena quinquepunctata]
MEPTRDKACLDNICANDNGPKVIDARVINNHFSDHFAQTVSMQFSENTDSHCNELYSSQDNSVMAYGIIVWEGSHEADRVLKLRKEPLKYRLELPGENFQQILEQALNKVPL